MNIGRPKLKKCRSFKQFCKDKNHTTKDILYPCCKCNGNGRIYDPLDPADVYEGNKLRNRIECNVCNGSGIGKAKDLHSIWIIERKKWLERKKEYNNIVLTLRNIESKLKKSEIKLLKKILADNINKYFV